MKKYLDKIAVVGALLTLIMMGTSSAVMALQTSPASTGSHASRMPASSMSASTTSKSAQTSATTAMSANMMRVCVQRQVNVTNIMNNITTRVTNQISLFGQIANSVESFSTQSGKTVPNYSTLVSSINSAQTKAQADLATLQQNATFSCNSGDPKAAITSFRGYVKVEVGDLENFRSTVKNLIVAVAKANNETITNQNNSGN